MSISKQIGEEEYLSKKLRTCVSFLFMRVAHVAIIFREYLFGNDNGIKLLIGKLITISSVTFRIGSRGQ